MENCAFCGSYAFVDYNLIDNDYRVCCKSCKTKTPGCPTEKEAIAFWNSKMSNENTKMLADTLKVWKSSDNS